MRRRGVAWGVAGLVILGLAGAYGWHVLKPGGPTPSADAAALHAKVAEPVRVALVARKTVPFTIPLIGSVQASDTVAVKSRIDGAITQVHFREGEAVKAGDLLFTLDSRSIQAELDQALANLGRDQAQLANSKRDLQRFSELARKDFATRQQLDTATTNTAVLQSTIKADQAAIENLRVQLSYTKIYAPIGGRTGSINLTAGNTVKANDTTPMVVINRIQPIRVVFAVPQRYFELVRQHLDQGPVEVDADIPNSSHPPLKGKIVFLDNTIDPNSGTFEVKALLDNPDGLLWPGMYVRVRVRLGADRDALVVASAAVQTGQEGAYVYTVDDANIAHYRPVKVLRQAGNESLIASGLKQGERVVVDGQLRLTDGTPVEILKSPPAAPGSAAAASQTTAGRG